MVCVLKVPRISFIGCGAIAEFHAEAAKEAGFILESVAGSKGSSRAEGFALRHGFRRFDEDPEDLAVSQTWDALLICSAHNTLAHYARKFVDSTRPVLVEKPVTLSSEEFSSSLSGNRESMFVAYNRRHYLPVAAAKEFLEESGPAVITVEIPESIDFSESDRQGTFKNVLANSVHMLDLMLYLAGPVTVSSHEAVRKGSTDIGRLLVGRTLNGNLVIVKAIWNSPSNFSIAIENSVEKFVLSPIEVGKKFSGMSIKEPSPSLPVRTYTPKLEQEVAVDARFAKFKPGFVEQMSAFRDFAVGGNRSPKLATAGEALRAILAAEVLLGFRHSEVL